MPRFFFHVRGPNQVPSPGLDGVDYPDVETAYGEVLCAAKPLAALLKASGEALEEYVIEVENGSGEMVFDLPFTEVLNRTLC
jgi:hypothetical protein